MSSPTVAILVRTKGRPRFLSRALENIAQQTFTDYTVCVINDGGDEQAARAVIEESPLDSGHVQLLTAGGNMEAASNAGLTATVSKYVAIHDDDDLWAPEFLERTVAALEESGALMCTTRIVERYERENADGEFEVYEERIFHDSLPSVGLQFLFRTNRTVPIGILYRRSLHELVGFYDESLPVVGDWEFNMRRVIDGHDLTRESLDILRSIEHRLGRIEARQQVIETRQHSIEERLKVLKHLRAPGRALRSLAKRSLASYSLSSRSQGHRAGGSTQTGSTSAKDA